MKRSCGVTRMSKKGVTPSVCGSSVTAFDDGAVVHHVALRSRSVNEAAIVERAAGVAFNLVEQERRLLGGVRIARVPEVVRRSCS